MWVFVYEYTCASADPDLPPSLRAEGRAMLCAVLEDFARLPDISTCTLLGPGLKGGFPCSRPCVNNRQEEAAFRRLAADADFTLLIAPESGNALLTRCRWILQAGGRPLGPGLDAVSLTADKLALARHFRQHGIPTPLTVSCSWPLREEFHYPAVAKPRYGAGSRATFLVRSAEQIPTVLDEARREMADQEMLLQPLIPGRAASVSLLLGPAGSVSLLPCEQHLSEDGRFHYLGGRVPLESRLCERSLRLARRAQRFASWLLPR